VHDVLRTVLAAIGVFAATNVDDLVVITVLFLAARTTERQLRGWHVWVGQYVGIGALVATSAAAAAGLRLVPDRWVGLLGVIPFGLGLVGLIRVWHDPDGEEPPVVARGLVSVTALAIANGGDNVAVYAPTFRAIGWTGTAIYVVVFAVCLAAMCAVGQWLGARRPIVALVERWGRWLVPLVFMVIGVAIFVETLP
jgi:cadmium resistance protein CadD (predicted permease)